MTSARKTVHSLLGPIFHANPDVIGIDGLDGCRKSTLAQRIAGHVHYQVIDLDTYLDKNKGAYVDHLNIDSIRSAVKGRRSIIEGVCLLKVIELAELELDLSIYVLSVFKQMEQTKRFSKGELCSSITYYAACR